MTDEHPKRHRRRPARPDAPSNDAPPPEDELDEAVWESFPASDPPSTSVPGSREPRRDKPRRR